jgi:Trk K+ transport system NAD-binding subunit
MWAVFPGGGSLAVTTARALLNRGHEVVMIELDKQVIDTPSAPVSSACTGAGEFLVPDDATRLRADDEVVLITHRDNLPILNERFETSRER